MLVHLYKGDGEIRDLNDANANSITISMEIVPQLRTWHAGVAFQGQVVPVIPGKELPPEQFQFVIRKSSVEIPAISFSFFGEKGYIYAEKLSGQPLQFQEWSINEIPLGGTPVNGLYSHEPPKFQYHDLLPWNCYSSVLPNTPEYGNISPVVDLSSNLVEFSKTTPPIYNNGAKLSLKIIQQTTYEVV